MTTLAAEKPDLTCETMLSLADAAKLLPRGRNGKVPRMQTVLKWVTEGSRSPSGAVVRLEAVRLGGRWVTSREALARFASRLTPEL